ncbi:MAG: hypothetical protein MR051_04645 [Lentisphaeria bacterium]|nr:hypothetical protein [Lentisphaeria bacterium]
MKRSLVFWMWNDELDSTEIRRQIGEFHAKHVDGFFIHTMPAEFRPHDFPGGMPGYLSEHFFAMVEVAVKQAAALGMEAWLYDEGGWPSGTRNGRLPVEHPELRMHHILSSGEITAVESRLDLLNPAATELFIRSTYEEYARRLGKYFGGVIPGIFTDEPFFGDFDPSDRLPWSPVLTARFEERKHYDARDAAMRILHERDPQAGIDYCEIWSSLIADGFMRPLHDWCHAHDLIFTGHFNGDDSVENVFRLLASDIFSIHRFFDMPGCDAIWRQVHPLMPETDLSRLTASAARGRRSISESFGVYGADLSLAEMKSVAAGQFASGIEVIAPMAIHYSDRGGRQVTTCSNFFGLDPRWAHYAQFSDFLRRMSKVFDRTVPVIKTSLSFPVRALRSGVPCPDLFEQGLRLARRQITYDYVPDAPEADGVPVPDIRLAAPCPALRTRHLKSPRGERRILINSGLEALHCRFAAPAGFNVWFDPATGKRTPARADRDGFLELDLPFGGATVLLTLPGRSQTPAAESRADTADRHEVIFRRGAVIRAFRAGENGLEEVTPVPPELPDNMCGTVRWETEIDADAPGTVALVLPEAKRAMVTLRLNGREIGTRLWGPYQWNIPLKAGRSRLELDISDTPAKALYAPEHVAYLEKHNFLNVYLQKCLTFQRIFPEEQPLAGAYWQQVRQL